MSIQNELDKIKNAIYGKEVRGAIHDGIKKAYDDASEKDNANMEVKIARGNHYTLRGRLEGLDSTDEYIEKRLDVEKKELNKRINDLIGGLDGTEVLYTPVELNEYMTINNEGWAI